MKGILGAFVFLAAMLIFSAGDVSAQRNEEMTWTGTVDDRVELVIRGRNVDVRTVRGRQYGDGRTNFRGGRRGGWRDNERARVSRREGRGSVRVVQQPTRRNGYTTIVRIDDSKGGQDRYRISVTWD